MTNVPFDSLVVLETRRVFWLLRQIPFYELERHMSTEEEYFRDDTLRGGSVN